MSGQVIGNLWLGSREVSPDMVEVYGQVNGGRGDTFLGTLRRTPQGAFDWECHWCKQPPPPPVQVPRQQMPAFEPGVPAPTFQPVSVGSKVGADPAQFNGEGSLKAPCECRTCQQQRGE